MDAKALAKSKRAHSQHHSKKHHPNPTLKTPSGGSGGHTGGKQPTGQQVREKSHQSRSSSALPSNWDRYEDEFESDSRDPSKVGTSHATDVILPKSKGADYAHLIAEAKSQSQTNYSSEIFPAFDDVLDDFSRGIGTLLSVKGQRILSSISDDFIVEDEAAASNEASFLSLDLNALAEQLAKADLSKRLFVEDGLLPQELFLEEFQESCRRDSGQGQATRGKETTNKDSGEIGETTLLKSIEELKLNPVENPNSSESSRFEAAAAEAELDMLLDSFNESPSSLKGLESVQLVSPQPLKKGPDLSKPATMAANLDDTIDDLLEETSNVIKQNGKSQPSNEVKTSPTPTDTRSSPSSSTAVSKSKLLDEFDSWLDTI